MSAMRCSRTVRHLHTTSILRNRGGYVSTVQEISKPVESIAESKNADELKIIFLEGPAAVGKSTVCNRLAKMGFTTRLENFVALCNQFPQYDPAGHAMTLKWTSGLLSAVEGFQQRFQNAPKSIRNGLVFLDRSFMTPYVYRRSEDCAAYEYALRLQEAVQQTVPRSEVILCHTEIDVLLLRLAQRYAVAPKEEERAVRQRLGEVDRSFLEQTVRRYDQLTQAGRIHSTLNTTDTRQATSMLLDRLGVQFALPTFPWQQTA